MLLKMTFLKGRPRSLKFHMGAELFCGFPKSLQLAAVAQFESAIGSRQVCRLQGGSSGGEFDDLLFDQ